MRTHEEFTSTLPRYQVTRSQDFPGFLIVMCGREDCPGVKGDRPFLVAEKEWMRPRRVTSARDIKAIIVTGRTCPYCSRAGRMPTRREIG